MYSMQIESASVRVKYELKIDQVYQSDRHSRLVVTLYRYSWKKGEWKSKKQVFWYWYAFVPERPVPRCRWTDAKKWIKEQVPRRKWSVIRARLDEKQFAVDSSCTEGIRILSSHS